MTSTATTDLHLRNFVNGGHVEAADGRACPRVDPSIGEVFADTPVSGANDVDLAMEAAATGFQRLARRCHPR